MFFLILPVQFLLTDLISSKSISASHQLLDFFHGNHLTFFIQTGFSHSCPSVELQRNIMSLHIHPSKDLFSKAKLYLAQNLAFCMYLHINIQLTITSTELRSSRYPYSVQHVSYNYISFHLGFV